MLPSLETVPCGFLAFADDGHLVSVNSKLCHMLGYEQAELTGQHVQELFSAGARIFYQTHFFPLLKLQGEVEEIYLSLRAKNGEEVPFLINGQRTEPEEGAFLSECILVRMRLRSHFEKELLETKKAAESASKAKDHFIAALSHELRTPLSPILMTATALELDPDASADVREQAGVIRRNAELEARLIDDLLDHSRIRHGKLALIQGPIDVHALLRQTEEVVRSEGATKGVAIIFEPCAQCHHVFGDAARLQQVFWNLIKNGVKFTPPGGEVRVMTLNDSMGNIEVRVTDTGIGIAPEVLPRVFNAFEQGSLAVGSFGGLGLGLAISDAIVKLHRGQVSVESPGVGKGASFSVTFETIPAPVPSAPATQSLGAAPGKLRLLLVEDHESTRLVLSRVLERSGYEVEAAATGSEALALVQSSAAFDALISDLGLPDQSGFELMRKMREVQPSIPAIALSGYGMEEDVQRARDAGFMAHLVKPVPFEQLRAVLEEINRRKVSP